MSTQLEAQWIVGFTDGEGCFNLDVHLHKETKWGIQMQPEFTVVQGEVDVNILHALKNRFGCGTVAVNRKDNTSTRMMYRVKNIRNCHNIIVPFADPKKREKINLKIAELRQKLKEDPTL